MKKIAIAASCLGLVFALAACDNSGAGANTSTGMPMDGTSSMAGSMSTAPASTAPESASSTTAPATGIVGEWEVRDVGYMGNTFTLDQLEQMVSMAEGQLDAVLADDFTADDLRNAIDMFKDMRVRFEEGGTGVIFHAGSAPAATSGDESMGTSMAGSGTAVPDQAVAWAQNGDVYEITINGETLPLTYSDGTGDTMSFSYLGFEVNFTRLM